MLLLSAIAAIVIFRPAFFPAEARKWRCFIVDAAKTFRGLLCAALIAPLTAAAANTLRIDIDRLDHGDFSLSELHLEVGAEGSPARIAIGRLSSGIAEWRNLRLNCDVLRLADGVIDCPKGMLALADWPGELPLSLKFDSRRGSGTLRLLLGEGESAQFSIDADGSGHFSVNNLPLATVETLLKPLAELPPWGIKGQLHGDGDYRSNDKEALVTFHGSLSQAGFSSADGLTAADNLDVDIDITAVAAAKEWRWEADVQWRQGEAYFHPLYLQAEAALQASGKYGGDRLSIEHAALTLEGVHSIEGSGEFDFDAMKLARAAVMVANADLAVVGPRFIAPVVAPARADSLTFAGLVSAGVEIEYDELTALSLGFDHVGFSDRESQLSLGPLNGVVPWRLQGADIARLQIDGGHWQKLTLGAFELHARMNGPLIELDRTEIPVLDGSVILSGLEMRYDDAGWEGSGAADILPISMKALTEAVGLPSMSGTLAAEMPGLHLRPGSLAFDGMLEISVFDGRLQVTNLQVIEPFKTASHLYADVAASRIDLGQLTETFSFGSVSGLIDARVSGLEMARWRPVKFDARIESSAGRYPRRISQRAVQSIGALGGAGAVAAIQRGVLGFFDSFGYRRIGLSCKLDNGVGVLDGLAGADLPNGSNAFLIVEGGGIPALNVIGYNRRMDWNELLDRLQRITEADADPIIQ